MPNQETQLTITRMGCLRLVPQFDLGPRDDESTKEIETIREEVRELVEDVGRLVREAPIVLEEPTSEFGDQYFVNRETQELTFIRPLIFKVHWPDKNQEHFLAGGAPKLEDFELWYDGNTYMITTEVSAPIDPGDAFHFGREGWRILENVLKPGERWSLETDGPSPMKPVVYIAVTGDPGSYSFGRDLTGDSQNEECLMILRKGSEVTRQGALHHLRLPAKSFYELQAARSKVFDHKEDLYEKFTASASVHRELAAPTPLNPLSWLVRVALSRKFAALVASVYTAYWQVEEARASAMAKAQAVQADFVQSGLFEPLKDYPLEQTKDVFDWSGHHILETLRFLSEESRNRSLLLATYIGSLLGALIGAGATAFGFWLGG